MVKPAVEGTIAVMKASQKFKVKKVVVTSSCAAVFAMAPADLPDPETGFFDDKSWSNTDVLGADAWSVYIKSKTLAEKAAWDF